MKQRELKFRAWDKDKKIMVSDIKIDATLWSFNIYIQKLQKYYILQQYTGLKDKQGKEIYEGDIVKWNVDGTYYSKSEIKWAKSEQGFRPYINNTTEVIGNIYENPELLKK